MNFSVGQKVVCINDRYIDPAWVWIPNRPVAGLVYTVRGFCPGGSNDRGSHRLYLEEITNPVGCWGGVLLEGSFPLRRFRPVVEKKTDISIFTEMLKPKHRELAQ